MPKTASQKIGILPPARPKIGAPSARATFEAFRHLVPPEARDDAVALLAIRGYYRDTMGRPGENDRGLYDDCFVIIEPAGTHAFNANTDPSRLRHGIASLKSHQAVRYRPGWHGHSSASGHPAYRQDSAVIVIRDGIGEDSDAGRPRFWINLHRGSANHTSSAGCLTVPPSQWRAFKATLDGALARHRQDTFHLVLVDARHVIDPTIRTRKDMPVPASSATPHDPVIAIVEALAALAARQPVATTDKQRQPAPSTPSRPAPDPALAEALAALAAALGERSKPGSTLTPVNIALGRTLGTLLDGRKTGLGMAGLLFTVLLPALAVPFPALAPVAGIAAQSADILLPLFSALTGWGVLGKIEKWVAAVRSA